jgi:Protein of unknown function (DUF2971)
VKDLYPVASFPQNEDFDKWHRALHPRDYFGRRVLLRAKLDRSLPRFLYKYRRLDQSHSKEKLREILVESVLELRAPAGFNDPFDMSARFVVEGTEEQRRERFKALVHNIEPRIGWKAEQQAVQRLMFSPENELRRVCGTALEGMRNHTGVYCFAGTPKSTLMWSHYAQDHSGICIQFERVRHYKALLHALPVVYNQDFPVVNWIDPAEAIVDMLFRKHPDWNYERESRLLLMGQAGQYLHLRPEAVTGIVFGCRATDAEHAVVNEVLSMRASRGHPSVGVYDAVKHPSKYRLVIRRQEI